MIVRYFISESDTFVLFQLGMLAQSGDFFDIWGMVDAGNAPENHGNAGTGTYIIEIGQREGRCHSIYTRFY